jgi:hypothetical protein
MISMKVRQSGDDATGSKLAEIRTSVALAETGSFTAAVAAMQPC